VLYSAHLVCVGVIEALSRDHRTGMKISTEFFKQQRNPGNFRLAVRSLGSL
jgi:hypothetical protein